jgi:purine-binding chemotaxis protein CheW
VAKIPKTALPTQDFIEEAATETAGFNVMTQYLTFRLDQEIFALDITKGREVLDLITMTKVPRTPEFMRGVINLRGSVVPVVDLRLKFGMSARESSVNTRIIITEVQVDNETVVLGTSADAVLEVLDLDAGSIEPPPCIGTRLRTEFIKGMGRQQGRFIIILDIDRMFSTYDLAWVKQDEAAERPAA